MSDSENSGSAVVIVSTQIKREIRNIREANELIVAAATAVESELSPVLPRREAYQVIEEEDDDEEEGEIEEEEEDEKHKVHSLSAGRASPTSMTSSAVCVPGQSSSSSSS